MSEKNYLLEKNEVKYNLLFQDDKLHQKYSMDEIYSFMNAFSGEIFPETTNRYASIDFEIVLPPLYYEGKFVKGLSYSQAPDLICSKFPKIRELFHIIAEPMSCNFPYQENCDGIFSLYKNHKREEWFRKTYPHRKDVVLVPLEDSDFIHEYFVSEREEEKIYDVIFVSRISEEKNLNIAAKALKIYREKYKKDLNVLWVVGRDFGENLNGLSAYEQSALKAMSSIFDSSYQYIKIIPQVKYKEMPKLYSQSKLCMFTSLVEGKNRGIREAMSCNIPVLLFKSYLQYVRAENDIIPSFEGNAGKSIEEFSPEALADNIETMLNNLNKYKPRQTYLKSMGRKNFFNTALDSFDYYKKNIPHYEEGNAINNMWIDLAIANNYYLSLIDFLYGHNALLQKAKGVEAIEKNAEFYLNKFEFYLNK